VKRRYHAVSKIGQSQVTASREWVVGSQRAVVGLQSDDHVVESRVAKSGSVFGADNGDVTGPFCEAAGG
jgi:hypothetical protein